MNRVWSCDPNKGKSPYSQRRHTAHVKCEFYWCGKKCEAGNMVPLEGDYESDYFRLKQTVKIITEFLDSRGINK